MNKAHTIISGFRFLAFMGMMVFFPCAALAITQNANPNAVKINADTLECDQKKNQCVAEGHAYVVKEDKQITGNKLIAHFVKDDENATTLTYVEAEGNVVLTLPNTVLQGDSGLYDNETEIAKVYGNVRITREKNQLNGKYGEVNFKTGQYKIFSKDPREKNGSSPSKVEALILTPPKKLKN